MTVRSPERSACTFGPTGPNLRCPDRDLAQRWLGEADRGTRPEWPCQHTVMTVPVPSEGWSGGDTPTARTGLGSAPGTECTVHTEDAARCTGARHMFPSQEQTGQFYFHGSLAFDTKGGDVGPPCDPSLTCHCS